ncbi:MAG: DPP IV N-terminal domain-containing protein [Planctomycetota bacterium]|nr:DPP IV N-terminal domain-containing protein [Planctomycetota bacterium]
MCGSLALVKLLLAVGCGGAAEEAVVIDPALLTVAERSGYRATASHREVLDLAEKLASSSPRIALETLGKTSEGRTIPLLLVGDPPPASAREARKAGKLVVLLMGNIHGGEVCGKEALLMLARDVGTKESHPLLENLVLAVVPTYNADGGDRLSKENRPRQVGPEEGTGARENAQGLDLNRDWVKLEAAESRALVRFLNEWDPEVVIDTHTTNGSRHRYALTYAGPKHPAGDGRIIEYVRDRMLPAVGRRLEESKGRRTFFYGNFSRDRARWVTYPDLPRYGTPYRGLRNRLAILSEAYAYAPYRERVLSTRDFVATCLEYLAENREAVRKLIRDVDDSTIQAGRDPWEKDVIALRTRAVPQEEKVEVLGFAEEIEDGERRVLDQPHDYEVELVHRFESTRSVSRPHAYLVPENLTRVVEKLLDHGIRVEELREDVELDVDVYRIDAVERAERAVQKHHLVEVEATSRNESRLVEAGTRVVRTDQPLGTLAVYLLEPLASDGLTAWNFFDAHLEVGADFPVLRLPRRRPLLLAAVRSADRPSEKTRLTFENVYEADKRPPGGSAQLFGLRWLADGEHFLQTRESKLLKVHAATGRFAAFHDAEAMARGLASLPTMNERTARAVARRTSFHMNPERSAALITHERDLYHASFAGDTAVRLTSTPQVEELATFSPDGRFVAFVRDHDLRVVDVETQTERALTTGGTESLRNGKASWVYFEEIFHRRWKTYWWSPDSQRIAYLLTDSSPVKRFTLVDERPSRQNVETSTYPKPGEPNPRVRLGVVSRAGGSTRWVDLSAYDENATLISGVGWWPDAGTLYFYVQDRGQTWLDFCTVSPSGGKPTRLFRETTGAWVESPLRLEFLADGSFLVSSERSGWRHLYHYSRKGELRGALTRGEWEVRRVQAVDEDGGWVYVSGTRDSSIAENLYRVKLDGSTVERLTTGPGSHRTTVGPGGRFFVDTWSSHREPPRAALFSGSGERVRMLDSNPFPERDDYLWCERELVRIPADDGVGEDGVVLEGSLLKPPDFDPARRYPVWFMTYGGPQAPTIRDSWSGGQVWDQVIAESGIIVFRADPRCASGKGAVSAWSCYKRLGVQELADVETAIRWLAAQPFVDPDRIGMSGHSYGGFLTAYALTHSKLFSAGIAGAPVTDWRDYDTIYTERYMLTPQENPEGYRETSVVEAAADLNGRLLILHGMMDDNVHSQNSVKLVDALQKAGKPFEMMFYPGYRHGIHGRHYRRLVWDFIQESVGRPAAAGEKPVAAAAAAPDN